MGGGSWSAATYHATTTDKITRGATFAHTAHVHSTGVYEVHPDLDPKKPAGVTAGAFAGQNVRESRDNAEHPNSVPVAVFFDETGSMGMVPRVVQSKLADLFGLLLRKGYVEDPQVMVGAYGDGVVDRVPLQVSQFESDNRIDDALDNVFLEGCGGGNFGESQWLAWYFLAYHTATDAWDKRGKKGYAFFIGDERALNPTEEEVKRFIGDGQPLCGSLDHETIVGDLLEKWDAYVFVINNGAAARQKSVEFYTNLFGAERVLIVQDHEAIAETIALTIGTGEGSIDLDDGVDDLKSLGASDKVIGEVTRALALRKEKGNIVTTDGAPEDLDSSDDDSVARL